MQNSLNQAFIRAYAKERDAVHAQAVNQAADSQAAEQRANEQLIMRFDTTTVAIPNSHLNARPAARQSVAVASQATTQATAQAVVQSRPQRTEEDELRASIASEMLRAGGWQDEQIASLGPVAAAPEQPRAPVFRPLSASVAEESEQRRERFPERSAERPQVDRSYGDQEATTYFTRESAPARPAQPDVMQHVKSGSIVRLDQPLSAAAQYDEAAKPVAKTTSKVAEQIAAPEMDVSQKYTDELGFAETEMRTATIPFNPSQATTRGLNDRAKKAESASTAKQVERELRRAKVRVFNPIWEVDQLQWPDVCVKLMDARMDSLSHVTKHLSDACQEGLQVLAVTSPEGGEGRTTVACCLAMLAGSRGMKVAIVDGDIENPTLCLQTNLEMENDWQSAILNHLPLEEVAVHSIDDQITLVPLLNPLDQTELPNTDQRIADMLIELSESFDLVIVDIGHMNSPGGLMQSLAEQGIINAAIAVVDQRNASTQRIETCIRRIRQAGVTSIGLVENFAA